MPKTTTPKPKTLDELKADSLVGLPESTYELCVAGKLNAEFERLDIALDDALSSPSTSRLNGNPEVSRINAKREKLRTQMAEYMVTLTFRAKPGHEWRRWVTANPPRENNELDEQLGFNVDALTDSLREYIVSVNGEPLSDDWWAMIHDNAAPGNLWKMTAIVRSLHQREIAVPKSLTGWIKSQQSDDA